MNKQEDVLYAFEDEYIDDLIRLVYKRDRLREARKIIEKSKEPFTPEQEKTAERIRIRMRDELAEADRQETKKKRKSTILRILPKIMEIAACLILVAAIGTTIAIAKDESFRSAVLQLLIQIDQEKGVANIRFEENAGEAFDVPADWFGEYYPSRIPAGFTVAEMSQYEEFPRVVYSSRDGKEIRFNENSYNTISTQGIEEADVSQITIHDRLALMVVDDTPGDSYCRITWSNDEKWFVMSTINMTKEETVELAESVRKIIPKDEKGK